MMPHNVMGSRYYELHTLMFIYFQRIHKTQPYKLKYKMP